MLTNVSYALNSSAEVEVLSIDLACEHGNYQSNWKQVLQLPHR